MSRRYRARREAIESKYVAMHSDDGDDMDWEDADYDSLAVYREAESTDQPIDPYGRTELPSACLARLAV